MPYTGIYLTGLAVLGVVFLLGVTLEATCGPGPWQRLADFGVLAHMPKVARLVFLLLWPATLLLLALLGAGEALKRHGYDIGQAAHTLRQHHKR